MSALQDLAVGALERAQSIKSRFAGRHGDESLLPALLHVHRGGVRVAEVWISETIAVREVVLRAALLGFCADAAVMVAEGLNLSSATDPRTGARWAGPEAVESYMVEHGEGAISVPALVVASVNAADDAYGGVAAYAASGGVVTFADVSWTVDCARSEVAEALAHAQDNAVYTAAVRAAAPDLERLGYAEAMRATDAQTVDYLRERFRVWVGLGTDVPFPAQG